MATDQLVSAQPGLVPQGKGTATRARIWGATIFVDHATDWTKVHLMQDASGDSTLEAKNAFERNCMLRNVVPRGYHADNGRYAENTFKQDCVNKNQTLTFCGVGAHHQNGVAESKIKQLTLSSRTMLLHAQRHWPEYITTMLWPFALLAAADRMNHLHIDINGVTPEMKFSQVTGSSTKLKHFHTFGCPVYVLDARLQDSGGGGPPKWDPRARLGIYLGHSPAHAGSVALVLNPKSGLISPQFHVVFDDDFSTVPSLRAGEMPSNWSQLVENSRTKSVDGFYDVTKTWFEGQADPADADPHSILPQADDKMPAANSDPEIINPSLISDNAINTQLDDDVLPAAININASAEELPQTDFNVQPSIEESSSDISEGAQENNIAQDYVEFDANSKMPPILNLQTAGLRRSPRIAAMKSKSSTSSRFNCTTLMRCFCTLGAAATTIWSADVSHLASSSQNLVFTTVNSYHMANQLFDNTLNSLHSMALLAEKEDNESYTFKEMLKQPDASEFIKAMMKESSDHETRGHWEVVPRYSKPSNVKAILAIWAFRRKRFPDGRINKHKARLCAHGGMQIYGVNYWDTYAPTVNWISIRFLLIVAQLLDLNTQAIDFVLAFPQADLEVPVYMELPAGMDLEGKGEESSRYLLKLKKSLYGLKQGSLSWHNKLKAALHLSLIHI